MTRAERMTPAEWRDIARDLTPRATERQLDDLWSALRWHAPDVVRSIGEHLVPGDRAPWAWSQAAGREQSSRDASRHAHARALDPPACPHGRVDRAGTRCPECLAEHSARAAAGAGKARAALAEARAALAASRAERMISEGGDMRRERHDAVMSGPR